MPPPNAPPSAIGDTRDPAPPPQPPPASNGVALSYVVKEGESDDSPFGLPLQNRGMPLRYDAGLGPRGTGVGAGADQAGDVRARDVTLPPVVVARRGAGAGAGGRVEGGDAGHVNASVDSTAPPAAVSDGSPGDTGGTGTEAAGAGASSAGKAGGVGGGDGAGSGGGGAGGDGGGDSSGGISGASAGAASVDSEAHGYWRDAAAAAARAFADGRRESAAVGPCGYYCPRHRLPLNSIDKGSKCVGRRDEQYPPGLRILLATS
jgi:hypothetical protein